MEKFRVLVVDDEEDFLETIVKRLKRRGIDTVGVGDGKTALALFGERHFDVVVLDLRMPGMDGLETLKEIKRTRPLVEVILLTGHGSVESGMQGMQMGAFDYMLKPADIGELIEKVRQAHERQRLHENLIRETKVIQ